jgi:hypothetical protein
VRQFRHRPDEGPDDDTEQVERGGGNLFVTHAELVDEELK